MKILVFSDSHSKGPDLARLAEAARPDCIFHLGDCVRDTLGLSVSAPVTAVRGNCDFAGGDLGGCPLQTTLDLEGVRVLLMHGHTLQVKTSLDRLWFCAREQGAQLALFGHTHTAYAAEKSGVMLFNPGSISEPRGGAPSYGVLTLENGTFTCRHIYL